MSVYHPLYQRLSSDPAPMITLSFEEVEQILGRSLPKTARGETKRQWWANTPTHTQALAWLKAKRKARLNVASSTVTFIKDEESSSGPKARGEVIELSLAQLDPAAIRILEDVAEETGGSLSGAMVALMNRAGRERRRATLDWFSANGGPPSPTSAVDMIREDRDAR